MIIKIRRETAGFPIISPFFSPFPSFWSIFNTHLRSTNKFLHKGLFPIFIVPPSFQWFLLSEKTFYFYQDPLNWAENWCSMLMYDFLFPPHENMCQKDHLYFHLLPTGYNE